MKDPAKTPEQVYDAVMRVIQESGARERASIWAVDAAVFSAGFLTGLFTDGETRDIVRDVRALLSERIENKVGRICTKRGQA